MKTSCACPWSCCSWGSPGPLSSKPSTLHYKISCSCCTCLLWVDYLDFVGQIRNLFCFEGQILSCFVQIRVFLRTNTVMFQRSDAVFLDGNIMIQTQSWFLYVVLDWLHPDLQPFFNISDCYFTLGQTALLSNWAKK